MRGSSQRRSTTLFSPGPKETASRLMNRMSDKHDKLSNEGRALRSLRDHAAPLRALGVVPECMAGTGSARRPLLSGRRHRGDPG